MLKSTLQCNILCLQHIDKLLSLLPSESLSEMDKVECDKVIWALMALEARGDAPPAVPSSHFRKGMKRYCLNRLKQCNSYSVMQLM